MNVVHYIGLDVHKKTISHCIKTAAGQIVKEGTLAAKRSVLRSWAGSLQQPWRGALEAMIFSDWIYAHAQAKCGTVGNGPSRKDESHHCGRRKAIPSMSAVHQSVLMRFGAVHGSSPNTPYRLF
jgi:hypothetical protein